MVKKCAFAVIPQFWSGPSSCCVVAVDEADSLPRAPGGQTGTAMIDENPFPRRVNDDPVKRCIALDPAELLHELEVGRFIRKRPPRKIGADSLAKPPTKTR